MPQEISNLSTTWNSAGTTYNGIRLSVTDTASNAASNLLELRGGAAGTTSLFKVFKDGAFNPGGFGAIGTLSTGWCIFYNGAVVGGYAVAISTNSVRPAVNLSPIGAFEWGANFSSDAPDLQLWRDASGTLAQRRGTNPQTFRIYNTFTDSLNNFERGKIAWESNVLRIGTEKGLTAGTARALELQTDGTTRLTIQADGLVVAAGEVRATSGLRLGASGSPNLFISSNILYFDSPSSGYKFRGSSFADIITISAAGLTTFADAKDIAFGTTTGTKIGTATTQKLGFYNATPVVQPTAVADATDAPSVITQLNALLSRMRDVGLIAT